jgi:sugar phosphate isomerase/epimerase
MQLGIVAKTFSRDSLAANLRAVAEHGFTGTQFNMKCVKLPTLPDQVSPRLCAEIRSAHENCGLSMAAISATFNIIHPDRQRLDADMLRFEVLACAAPAMGTELLTLCTGTRDPNDMWKHHPENDTTDAWREMIKSMQRIVAVAEQARVTVLVEPELSNVVSTAVKARLLLDELASPRLKVLMDGANLIDSTDKARIHDLFDEAMELLGPDIVLAHAKDVIWDGGPVYRPPGGGLMDYDYYLQSLSSCGYTGPLIMHELEEQDVPTCSRFVRDKLAKLNDSKAADQTQAVRGV